MLSSLSLPTVLAPTRLLLRSAGLPYRRRLNWKKRYNFTTFSPNRENQRDTPSSSPPFDAVPRRSYLYVPASSTKMLNKSHTTEADTIIYDLEDSVAPSQKHRARSDLVNFLVGIMNSEYAFPTHRVAIRINDLSSPYFADDIEAIKSLGSNIAPTIVVPKVEGPEVLGILSDHHPNDGTSPWNVVASIESANALLSMDTIVAHEFPKADIVALLFAAEDYFTVQSRHLIAARSSQVNINYQDEEYHREECLEGRQLGFTGKQAIHPSQVAGINEAYRPSDKAVLRAAKIMHQTKLSHDAGSGAFGLMTEGGKKEMIDAPMLKQAEATLRMATMCGVAIPDVGES